MKNMNADKQLQHDVLAQLEWEPSLDASQIGVAAKDGVVTLTGSVATYTAKMTAERATKSIYGVRGVANDIEVKIPGSSQRSDADIVAAALSTLRWDATVPDEQIRVTVRNGWLTLEGEVEWQYQRNAAESDVRRLIGVQGVTNQITVRTHVKPGDIKQKIENAFKRNAELDARRVAVETHDGKVVLRGNVRSWAERDEAQLAAWAAPGVVEVENQISVTP
jgi:osmotically-inducible protein OsmY